MNITFVDCLTLFFFGFLGFIYTAPTLRAAITMHPNVGAIFVVNIMTGWTGVGWVVAMAWAFTKGKQWQK